MVLHSGKLSEEADQDPGRAGQYLSGGWAVHLGTGMLAWQALVASELHPRGGRDFLSRAMPRVRVLGFGEQQQAALMGPI